MFAYTWDDFDRDIAVLVEQITDDMDRQPFTAIYGIPRSGLVPAVALSHRLGVPLELRTAMVTPSMLVVDDNTITGDSLRGFAAAGCRTAVLVHRPEGLLVPSYSARTSFGWPIMPWETTRQTADRAAVESAR